ncbi:MAG: hypothetical protein ACWGPN_17030 [Gammaproteobacteria bacterium]
MFALVNELQYASYQGYVNGAGDDLSGDFLIKPSFPFQLKNGKTLVLRGTLPINLGETTYRVKLQDFTEWRIRQFAYLLPAEEQLHVEHSFMDDLGVDFGYGGVGDNGYITMFGAAAVFPSSQDGSGERDQYLLGPQIAFGKVSSWGLVGAWVTHIVDVANISKKVPSYDTRTTSVKVFFSYGLRNGWQIISNPLIEYDWEALDDNKLLFPIGGGVAKTASLGNMPLRMNLELYKYIESPAALGPDWFVRFGVTTVFKDRSGR